MDRTRSLLAGCESPATARITDAAIVEKSRFTLGGESEKLPVKESEGAVPEIAKSRAPGTIACCSTSVGAVGERARSRAAGTFVILFDADTTTVGIVLEIARSTRAGFALNAVLRMGTVVESTSCPHVISLARPESGAELEITKSVCGTVKPTRLPVDAVGAVAEMTRSSLLRSFVSVCAGAVGEITRLHVSTTMVVLFDDDTVTVAVEVERAKLPCAGSPETAIGAFRVGAVVESAKSTVLRSLTIVCDMATDEIAKSTRGGDNE